MVLEALLSSRQVERKPIEMLVYTIIVTSISLWTSYIIFPSSCSVVFLFLTTIALIPLIYGAIKDDEKNDEECNRSVSLGFWERHGKILKIYGYFFLGAIIATSFWYTFLPAEQTSTMFALEIETTEALGAFNSDFSFLGIMINNLKVMLLAFLVSFIFGTGALFILGWNAAIVGIFIGNIGHEMTLINGSKSISYVMALLQGIASISIHGIPEIAAYCLAGISGAILSLGIIRGCRTEVVAEDSLKLFLISTAIIIISAVLEVYVTPNL